MGAFKRQRPHPSKLLWHHPSHTERSPVWRTTAVPRTERSSVEGKAGGQSSLQQSPTPQHVPSRRRLCQRASTYQIPSLATINTFLCMGNVNLFYPTVHVCNGLLQKINSWEREDGNYFKKLGSERVNKQESIPSGTAGWHQAWRCCPEPSTKTCDRTASHKPPKPPVLYWSQSLTQQIWKCRLMHSKFLFWSSLLHSLWGEKKKKSSMLTYAMIHGSWIISRKFVGKLGNWTWSMKVAGSLTMKKKKSIASTWCKFLHLIQSLVNLFLCLIW